MDRDAQRLWTRSTWPLGHSTPDSPRHAHRVSVSALGPDGGPYLAGTLEAFPVRDGRGRGRVAPTRRHREGTMRATVPLLALTVGMGALFLPAGEAGAHQRGDQEHRRH